VLVGPVGVVWGGRWYVPSPLEAADDLADEATLLGLVSPEVRLFGLGACTWTPSGLMAMKLLQRISVSSVHRSQPDWPHLLCCPLTSARKSCCVYGRVAAWRVVFSMCVLCLRD